MPSSEGEQMLAVKENQRFSVKGSLRLPVKARQCLAVVVHIGI